MSAKKELAAKDERIAELETQLAEAESDAATHLANVERLSPKAARTGEAEAALKRTHEDRDDAWKQVAALQQQVAERDVTIRGLAEENETLKTSLGTVGAEVPS
jgi:chromosome segregation ATPase